jgi:hypothetical protein
MKKLIAIAVIFALIAGTAFAETSLGGQVFVGGALLQGDNIEKSDITTGAIENDMYNTALKISFSEGDAGGRIRILGQNAGKADIFDEWFGWWKPIPQLRLQIGSNQDGDFGTAQISGWGFTGENKNNSGNQGAIAEYSGPVFGLAHARVTGWYAGTGGTANLQFSIFPAEGLAVNVWFPWADSQVAGFTLARFHAQVVYKLPDIGTASLSYQSDTGYIRGTEEGWWGTSDITTTPKIYASFYLTAIENMGVDLGLAYKFPLSNAGKERDYIQGGVKYKEDTFTRNYPVEIGLGFKFGSGDFNFKLRSGIEFGESEIVDDKDVREFSAITRVSANILPSYKIGNITVFFYAGLGIQSVKDWEKTGATVASFGVNNGNVFRDNESNSVVSWFVNPYVFIPAGGLRFKVGFQLYSDGRKADLDKVKDGKLDGPVVNWAIPFGFYAYL